MEFLPQHECDVYGVVKKAPEQHNDILPARAVWIDPYTGEIRQELNPRQYTPGDVFEQWLYPLHTGEAFGLAGRFLVVLLGMIRAMLFVTGFVRWR